MAKENTTETTKETSEKEVSRKSYIVRRIKSGHKGPIVAHDGSTGENVMINEGKAVELTPHMVAGLKDAAYPESTVIVDEKTGQSRTEVIMKRMYSIEEE